MNKLNKRGQMTLGLIIVIFMGLIVGLALFNASADQIAVGTTKATTTDETTNLTTAGCYTAGEHVNVSLAVCNITVTNAPTGWKITECPLESVVVTNAAGTVLVLDTDYELYASSGIVQMLNTTSTNETALGGSALVDYTFCRDGYMKDASSRTVINLVLIFLALALAAFMYLGIKDFAN